MFVLCTLDMNMFSGCWICDLTTFVLSAFILALFHFHVYCSEMTSGFVTKDAVCTEKGSACDHDYNVCSAVKIYIKEDTQSVFSGFKWFGLHSSTQLLYTHTCRHQFSFCTSLGVKVIGLYRLVNAVAIFILSCIPCLISYFHLLMWLYSVTLCFQRLQWNQQLVALYSHIKLLKEHQHKRL
jgi:hypothetical protein